MSTTVYPPRTGVRALLADETLAFLHRRYRQMYPGWSDRQVWSGIQAGLDLTKAVNRLRLVAIGDYLAQVTA